MTTVTVEGVVKNGVVVPDTPINAPDGTRVKVCLPDVPAAKSETPKEPMSDLACVLLKHAGTLADLPEDAAAQHDHYLYGTPKR